APPPAAPAAATANATPTPTATATPTATPIPTANATPSAAPADGRMRASPYVRKVARERDIDLGGVAGTGPRGRIVARDLEHAPAPAAAQPVAPAHALAPRADSDEVRPLSMMRKPIAHRLTESQ